MAGTRLSITFDGRSPAGRLGRLPATGFWADTRWVKDPAAFGNCKPTPAWLSLRYGVRRNVDAATELIARGAARGRLYARIDIEYRIAIQGGEVPLLTVTLLDAILIEHVVSVTEAEAVEAFDVRYRRAAWAYWCHSKGEGRPRVEWVGGRPEELAASAHEQQLMA